MAMRFYNFACDLLGEKEITLDNRDILVEKLHRLSRKELSEKTRVSKLTAPNYRSLIEKEPSPVQRRLLKTVYDLAKGHEDGVVSVEEVLNYLHIRHTNSNQVSFKFLQLIGMVKDVSERYRGCLKYTTRLRINMDLIKKWWPDIENWNDSA